MSLIAEWLGWASHGHGMRCHDLEIMGSNPDQVEYVVRRTSVNLYSNYNYPKQTKHVYPNQFINVTKLKYPQIAFHIISILGESCGHYTVTYYHISSSLWQTTTQH